MNGELKHAPMSILLFDILLFRSHFDLSYLLCMGGVLFSEIMLQIFCVLDFGCPCSRLDTGCVVNSKLKGLQWQCDGFSGDVTKSVAM